MNTQQVEHLKKQIYIEYLENQKDAVTVGSLLNISPHKVKYYAYSFKTNKIDFLRTKYTKEFLVNLIEGKTFKEAGKILNLSLSTFSNLLRFHNIHRDHYSLYKKNKVNVDFYEDEKYDKEFHYFLGLFASDGGFHKNTMRISIKNKGAKELLNKLALSVGHNNIRSYKNDYFELNLSDKNLVKKLIDLGIPYKNKTYKLEDIYIKNAECLLCFLCGLFDGDGHVSYSKSKFGYKTSLGFNICNYNEIFLLNLQKKIKDMLGFNSIVYKCKSSIPVIYIGARNNSKLFFEKMYSTSSLYLECKYSIYKDIISK